MSGFDAEAEALQRLVSDISSLLGERDQLKQKGLSVGDLVGRVRTSLTKADKQLERVTLNSTKAEGGAPVSQKEATRRRDIVRRCTSELARVKAQEKSVTSIASSATDRDALLGGGGSGGSSAEAPPRQSAEALMTRTKDENKVQDDILESMSRGLEGLKTMGVAIRDENELQMKLLDNLEDEVDKGTSSLKREAARAEYVTRDANTCWLYITICLLLGILVGLIAYK
jgi:hypothetical protein